MYETIITLRVLSEREIPDQMDIADVVRESDEGDFVMHTIGYEVNPLSHSEMAKALLDAGSDPAFFEISG
jgi:hypothetical protein